MQDFNLLTNGKNSVSAGTRLKANSLVRNKLADLSVIKPWRSGLAIFSDWVIIAACIGWAEFYPAVWSYLVAVLVIAGRQHALLVLMHEGAHLRLHKSALANDLLSECFTAFPLLADTAGYRAHHHAHHRHLNTEKDPDWSRKIHLKEWQYPKARAVLIQELINNLYRCPIEWAQLAWYFSFRSRWRQKLFYWAVIGAVIVYAGVGLEFIAYWVVPLFLIFPWFQRIRSIAEHFGLPYDSELRESRNVNCGWIEALFLGPHNVGHHLTHHLFPAVPFYNLAELTKFLNEIQEFSMEAHQNRSYLIPVASSVWKDLATVSSARSSRKIAS